LVYTDQTVPFPDHIHQTASLHGTCSPNSHFVDQGVQKVSPYELCRPNSLTPCALQTEVFCWAFFVWYESQESAWLEVSCLFGSTVLETGTVCVVSGPTAHSQPADMGVCVYVYVCLCVHDFSCALCNH